MTQMVRVACGAAIALAVCQVVEPQAHADAAAASEAAFGPQAQAAPAALPSGREVVDRYLQAIGGADTIAATTSWQATGTFELPGQGITGSLQVFSARPAKSLVKVTIAGIGDVLSGYDGKVGWSIDPLSGPSLQTGRALTQAADDAHFDAVLHPEAFTRELTTVERLTFDGQAAYKIKVVFASGREQFEYYGVESALQLGTEGVRETPMGAVPTVTYLRDYRRFGPLLQATEIVQQPLGIQQVIRITAFEYDNVPDRVFALPPPIQALIKR